MSIIPSAGEHMHMGGINAGEKDSAAGAATYSSSSSVLAASAAQCSPTAARLAPARTGAASAALPALAASSYMPILQDTKSPIQSPRSILGLPRRRLYGDGTSSSSSRGSGGSAGSGAAHRRWTRAPGGGKVPEAMPESAAVMHDILVGGADLCGVFGISSPFFLDMLLRTPLPSGRSGGGAGP